MDDEGHGPPRSLWTDLHLALIFLTRLPLPSVGIPPPGALAAAMAVFPVVGVVVAVVGAAVYALAAAIPALPPVVAASLAVAAMILLTGALHEDGLADVADGFGGGFDKDRKLAIMKDSRIGSYGALTLGLALLLRVQALAALERPGRVAATLLAVETLSRAVLPLLLHRLPPARESGLAAAAGRPTATTVMLAWGLAGGLTLLALPLIPALVAMAASGLAAVAVMILARRQIGGHTGDVLGAAQQAAQIGGLLALMVVMRM